MCLCLVFVVFGCLSARVLKLFFLVFSVFSVSCLFFVLCFVLFACIVLVVGQVAQQTQPKGTT